MGFFSDITAFFAGGGERSRGERRSGPRRSLHTDARRYKITIDGESYQLKNISAAGFAATGDTTNAPRRGAATIYRDGRVLRRGEAIMAWNDGRTAGYQFVYFEDQDEDETDAAEEAPADDVGAPRDPASEELSAPQQEPAAEPSSSETTTPPARLGAEGARGLSP